MTTPASRAAVPLPTAAPALQAPRGARRWSVSQVKTYETCPRLWWFKYVKREKVDVQTPMHWRFGTVVHAGLEAAFRAHLESKTPLADVSSMEDYLDAAVAAIEKAWRDEKMPETGGDHHYAIEQVEGCLRAVKVPPRPAVLGVEHRFLRPTPDGTWVVGFSDLVLRTGPDSVLIRDWKSNSSPRPADELAGDFQLGTYAWFAREEWPWVRKVYASHYHTPIAREAPVQIHDDAIEDAVTRIEAVAEMAEMDREYTPRPSEACGDCVFRKMCPAWQDEPRDGSAANAALLDLEGF